ncbi:MAG: hypothetical protein ACSHYB_00200 [Roseibacillus sp.]
MTRFLTHSLLLYFFVISSSSGQVYSPSQSRKLPKIPTSTRILTLEEVRNYWVNQLSRKSLPKKPSGLHPEKQARWRTLVTQRRQFIASIRAGHFQTEANLALLRHNFAAYTALKQDDEAEKTATKLRNLENHLAKMKTLRLQQEAAKKELAASQQLTALRNEISQLESEVSQLQSDSCSSESEQRPRPPRESKKASPRPAPGLFK